MLYGSHIYQITEITNPRAQIQYSKHVQNSLSSKWHLLCVLLICSLDVYCAVGIIHAAIQFIMASPHTNTWPTQFSLRCSILKVITFSAKKLYLQLALVSAICNVISGRFVNERNFLSLAGIPCPIIVAWAIGKLYRENEQ